MIGSSVRYRSTSRHPSIPASHHRSRLAHRVIDVALMTSASHAATQQNIYPVQIEMVGIPISIGTPRTMGANLKPQGILLLIGRDVLQHGTLMYNGIAGQITFSILRVPDMICDPRCHRRHLHAETRMAGSSLSLLLRMLGGSFVRCRVQPRLRNLRGRLFRVATRNAIPTIGPAISGMPTSTASAEFENCIVRVP